MNSYGWSHLGHRLVCDIAYQSLTQQTKRKVVRLIRIANERTFADACTWPDRIRGLSEYDWAKPHHYINVPKRARSISMSRDCSSRGCVISAIKRHANILKTSRSTAERVEALRFLGHFVGDVHQPLHVSYKNDLGGNRVRVSFMGKRTNLHKVWDQKLITLDKRANWRQLGADLYSEIDIDDRQQWRSTDPVDWANESFVITRTEIYKNRRIKKNLNKAYFNKFNPLVLKRIKMAGTRLAQVLEAALSNSKPTRDRGSTNPGTSAPTEDTNNSTNSPGNRVTTPVISANTIVLGGDYYQGVSVSDKGIELHRKLHRIIRGHKILTYKQVWTALEQTDEDPAYPNNIILLYTGRSTPKSNRTGRASGPDTWNREHVWAKSHGFPGKGQEAYTDIHHLRPTDQTVNSDRGNKDFDNGGTPHHEAAGARMDADSFEPPNRVKGDVARMMFYMAVRYEGERGSKTPDLKLIKTTSRKKSATFGHLCTLLKWHKADPVDEWEQRRNKVIYQIQGNRNPFIDRPGYAEKIWGTRCP